MLLFLLDLLINWRSLPGLVVAVTLVYFIRQFVPNDTAVGVMNFIVLVAFVGGGVIWQLRHRRKYEMKIQEKITKWMKENLNF